jgi:tRNA-dihydrouridine synthase 1
MEDLPLIQSMVTHLATNLTTPVSCKIRIFPDMGETLAYARMLEDAGCSLLAVHGRTREQKDGRATRADWEAIKAVKDAVRIPVLANGNIRWLEDVHECMKVTGVEGVMSAESLLENPALFAGHRMKPVEDVAGSLEELSRVFTPL